MPVSSNFRAISTLILIGALGACKPAATSSESQKVSYDEVSRQIGKIDVKYVPFDELPGETRAEKLLYQSGIVSQMQAGMLLMFDAQAKTLRAAGNEKAADELDGGRDLLMQAVDLEMSGMIEDAGLLYTQMFEPEEIERLIILHSDPAMQKLILNQPKLTQDMIPIGEQFGLRVGLKYQELLAAQAAE